jgi:hypothetical protein
MAQIMSIERVFIQMKKPKTESNQVLLMEIAFFVPRQHQNKIGPPDGGGKKPRHRPTTV